MSLHKSAKSVWTSYSDNDKVWICVLTRKGTRGAIGAAGAKRRGILYRGREEFHNMCFSETNPPFWRDFLDASRFEYSGCDGNEEIFSVGSFWKTNPPGGGFREVFTALSIHFDPLLGCERRADADAMGRIPKDSWRSWLREGLLVSWETVGVNDNAVSRTRLRQVRSDRSEGADAGLTTAGRWGLLRVGRFGRTESLSMEAL
jgi:hypothetical protein